VAFYCGSSFKLFIWVIWVWPNFVSQAGRGNDEITPHLRRTAWGVQGGKRRLQADCSAGSLPLNGGKAVSGVAHLQGVER
jgi:hypothetical protein